MNPITQEQAAEFLRYEPETGRLVWIKKASDKTMIGKRAGWQRSPGGYRQVGFKGQILYEHRLIWLLVTGRFPACQVDHINGIKDDNRLENLREASSSQNIVNIGAKRDNKSGAKNVHWCRTKQRWVAKVKLNGRTKHAGEFRDYEQAVEAAAAARAALHGEFASQFGYELHNSGRLATPEEGPCLS